MSPFVLRSGSDPPSARTRCQPATHRHRRASRLNHGSTRRRSAADPDRARVAYLVARRGVLGVLRRDLLAGPAEVRSHRGSVQVDLVDLLVVGRARRRRRRPRSVPGRTAMRNGFRWPWATTWSSSTDPTPTSGLSAGAAPVSGSRRTSAPSHPTGSPSVRMSWALNAPPSERGGARPAHRRRWADRRRGLRGVRFATGGNSGGCPRAGRSQRSRPGRALPGRGDHRPVGEEVGIPRRRGSRTGSTSDPRRWCGEPTITTRQRPS